MTAYGFKKTIKHILGIISLVACAFIGLYIGYSFFYQGPLVQNLIKSTQESGTPEVNNNLDAMEVVRLTNEERVKINLPELEINDVLNASANDKALDMLDRDYWSHDAPDGTKPWDFIIKQGYEYAYAAENLARGYQTPSEVVQGLMESPGHRENILDSNYTQIGIAAVPGNLEGEDTILVVQMFASEAPKRDPNYKAPVNQTSLSINEVLSYRDNIRNIKPSWERARGRFPDDRINFLIDSFTRQLSFLDTIINNHSSRGSFSQDDLNLWNGVIKMGNETSLVTSELNKQ